MVPEWIPVAPLYLELLRLKMCHRNQLIVVCSSSNLRTTKEELPKYHKNSIF